MKTELQAAWYIPAKPILLPDGSTLIKPGRAIQRAKASQCARFTGVHRRVLANLAECGYIRRASPSPAGAMYYPAEIEEFIARTEADPAFWNEVRIRAYLSGKTIRKSTPK